MNKGDAQVSEPVDLKRSVSLPMVTLYGLGTIIGAGIFVLIGKVAGIAGIYAPISFLVASIIAAFTAFSYAELASRFPKSAGEAIYLEEVFHRHGFSVAMGLAIAAVGIISAATITNGAVGYIRIFIDLPPWLIVLLLVAFLTLLAAWGISASVAVASFTTAITIVGLIIVIVVNHDALALLPSRLPQLLPGDPGLWGAIVFGGFVAFYAFIGFEDMINIAEEVKSPERNMPLAILLALAAATVLYLLISLVAVLAHDPAKLAASDAPLTALIADDRPAVKLAIGIISILAIVDGILIQIIKSSRILYGMSRQRLIPPLFDRVHPYTQTPLLATVTVAALVLLLSLSLPLLTLAQSTSFITLLVFAIVNFTLWRLKTKGDAANSPAINLPLWVPAVGAISCIVFILIQLLQWP